MGKSIEWWWVQKLADIQNKAVLNSTIQHKFLHMYLETWQQKWGKQIKTGLKKQNKQTKKPLRMDEVKVQEGTGKGEVKIIVHSIHVSP